MNTPESITRAIQEANTCGLLQEVEGLSGFSGKKLIGTLQRLAKNMQADTCYLEIGVFQGLTLLSVGSVTTAPVFGIDNFAFFDPKGQNLNLVKQRQQKLQLTNVHLINKDYEDALAELPTAIGDKKISVYFIDGPHDYRSQLVCLLFALPYLADDAVIIVDDSNYAHVRQANRDFLVAHPEFKLLFETYTEAHPQNLKGERRKEAENGWWNGVNVIVWDKKNQLPPMYPPTIRSRKLYENEHIVHASRFPEGAIASIALAENYAQRNLLGILKHNWNFFKRFRLDEESKKKFRHMNTYSEHLPRMHFNK